MTTPAESLQSPLSGSRPHGAQSRPSPPANLPGESGLRESAQKIPESPQVAAQPIRLVAVDLSHAWPHVAASLERVRERGARWPIDYVRDEIEASRAAVFRLVRGGEHLAYLLVERRANFEVTLVIWAMAGDFGDDGLSTVDEVVGLIDQLARNVGASRWRVDGRDGWLRVMRDRASRSYTVFERDVP